MSTETEKNVDKTVEPHPPTDRGAWLQNAREAISIRGEKPFEFTPITIKGESLTETIIRERRGEF